MAKLEKIQINPICDIAFDKLVLSQANVRRTKAGHSIEELAEDIGRRGLLQSLHVRPVCDADGVETGLYEIPAGGRRFRALQLLVKQKRMAKTQSIPCIIKRTGLAQEDSLAENAQRAALHPLDQFRAFKELLDHGLTEEDIAARFFVSAHVVKQRLRLASVAPALLDLYAQDEMNLEQLMAFTIINDQPRQIEVWEAAIRSGQAQPWALRRQLTQANVPLSDRRVLFIGRDAYESAGGQILRDLFSEDDDGWLEDVALLDRLVREGLHSSAETIAAEGWKWVDAAQSFPYGHANGMRRIEGVRAEIDAETRASIDALNAEFEKLENDYANADELPEAVDQRLGEIETMLETLEAPRFIFEPADMARAGVFVSLDSDGALLVERGFVRGEDEPAECEDASRADEGEADGNGAPRGLVRVDGGEAPEAEDDVIAPLPERLVAELTAFRTLALREALAGNPEIALIVLLHRLCGECFYGVQSGCLEASVRRTSFTAQANDLRESPPARALSERHESWRGELPDNAEALWSYLFGLDDATRLSLLAHCVANGLNAQRERVDIYGPGPSRGAIDRRIAEADEIAHALGLSLVDAGWRTSVDNYLGRVPKVRIIEAVTEAKGADTAALIAHMKKPDMAREAERLLDGGDWLPEPLRNTRYDQQTPTLPAFLDTCAAARL